MGGFWKKKEDFGLGEFKQKKGFLSTLLPLSLFLLISIINNLIKMQLSPRKKCLLCLISLV